MSLDEVDLIIKHRVSNSVCEYLPVRRSAAEDKIAVAKRVQMNKQLVGARSRASTSKPPPATAKRSTVFRDEFDVTEPMAPVAGPAPRKVGAQTARKSTGGRRPPPPPP
ncbi:hypothetical protein IWW39_005095 [Coemansia spiralis]|uniref:Uncharacterized protein n=1 Tax=Coemansia spiralis TaxID=417178 RepID=A0A9W8GBP3_9FUNG|nr:hypothetical protein IWW39_005095 [Coemansia spiralis]